MGEVVKIDRPDWSAPAVDDGRADGVLPNLGGRWTPGSAMPTPANASRPSFTREDLALLEDEPDTAAIDAELDAEEEQRARNLRRLGFTEEEAKLPRAGEPGGKPAVPAVTLESVEAELAKIAEARRNDRRAYFRDEAMQARELALIEQRQQLEEAQRQEAALQGVVESTLGAIDGSEPFEQSFAEVFDALPESAQALVRDVLSSPADPVRMASDADLQRFAEGGAEQAELVRDWGRGTPRRLAILRDRMERLIGAGDELAEWFDDLPRDEARAVMQALAG